MKCWRCGHEPEWPAYKTEDAGWYQTLNRGLLFGGYFWCQRHKKMAGIDMARSDARLLPRELSMECDRLYHQYWRTQGAQP